MTARFVKMTGSGNDFVMLDGRDHAPEAWPPERVAAVCHRRLGAGADGVVIVAPRSGGAVRMTYFNADGSRGEMCGNAALCSVRLATRWGLVPGDEVRLETDAGLVVGRRLDGPEAAEIVLPDFELPQRRAAVGLLPGERWLRYAVVGVPHVTILVDKLHEVDVLTRGKSLRYDVHFKPDGANVNFVAEPGASGDPWGMRTYERGVEAETLACGTGTVASAFAVALELGLPLPLAFRSAAGYLLEVAGSIDAGWARGVRLRGMGRVVYEGAFVG